MMLEQIDQNRLIPFFLDKNQTINVTIASIVAHTNLYPREPCSEVFYSSRLMPQRRLKKKLLKDGEGNTVWCH